MSLSLSASALAGATVFADEADIAQETQAQEPTEEETPQNVETTPEETTPQEEPESTEAGGGEEESASAEETPAAIEDLQPMENTDKATTAEETPRQEQADDDTEREVIGHLTAAEIAIRKQSFRYGIGAQVAVNDLYKKWLDSLPPAKRARALMEKADPVYGINRSQHTLSIREKPDASGRIIGSLPQNAICFILEEGGAWNYIESGDARGYVTANKISKDVPEHHIIPHNSTMGADALPLMAKVYIAPEDNMAFAAVEKTAYAVPVPEKKIADNIKIRKELIEDAMKYLGGRYVYGGESLTSGCDCSAFTRGIYAHFGINLPRSSYEQALTGTLIAAKDARPGDLLYYARDGYIYHVLMYIGEGKAINAKSTNAGIVISDVNYNKVCWATTHIPE